MCVILNKFFHLALFISVSLLSTLSASAADISCPLVDAGYQGGCLELTENPEHAENPQRSDARLIRLFYQFKGQFRPGKVTIVGLQGGPGLPLSSIEKLANLKLAENFNVLLFDYRGMARSSVINTQNRGNADFEMYHTQNLIDDIEQLRAKVIKQDKIIVVGHSYGASLALGYAVKYPQNTLKAVALGGLSNSMGFVNRYDSSLENFYRTAISSAGVPHPRDLITRLIQDWKTGKLKYKGRPETLGSFEAVLLYAQPTHSAAMSLRRYINELIAENQAVLNAPRISPRVQGAEILVGPAKRFEYDLSGSLNEIMNDQIICADLITSETIQTLDSNQAMAWAEGYRNDLCKDVTARSQSFDIKSKLRDITAPILLVGGKYDPWTQIEAIAADFQELTAAQKTVKFLTVEKAGHFLFSESPACIEKHLGAFLSGRPLTEAVCKD